MEDGGTKSGSEGERESDMEMRHRERDNGRHVNGRRENRLIKSYTIVHNILVHIRGYCSTIVKKFTIGRPGNGCFFALMLK